MTIPSAPGGVLQTQPTPRSPESPNGKEAVKKFSLENICVLEQLQPSKNQSKEEELAPALPVEGVFVQFFTASGVWGYFKVLPPVGFLYHGENRPPPSLGKSASALVG